MTRALGRVGLLAMLIAALWTGAAAAAITPTRDANALARTLDAGTVTGAALPFVAPSPDGQAECADGADNDADGATDYPADTGCASAADNRELEDAPAQCANGVDDDDDGLVDFGPDPGCGSAADDNEADGDTDPVAARGNGLDDDNDGKADLADPGCASLSDLDEGSEGLPPAADSNPAAIGGSPGLGGFPTSANEYVLLSTGSALSAADPNDSPGTTQSNGDAPNSASHGNGVHDLVTLRVDFTVPATANCARLDFRFLSEEYPEFVDSAFNDGFVAELDTSDFVASTGSITAPHNFAFDAQGKVISINTTGFSEGQAAGTTYDGATPLLRASTPVAPGAHSLYLSVFDFSDSALDSTAFVDHLRIVDAPGSTCKTGASDDVAAPDTAIASGPGATTEDTTPDFAFTSTEDPPGFQCKLDAADFANCASPYTTPTLDAGPHVLQVRAVDAAGNVDPTPAEARFTVGEPTADLQVTTDQPDQIQAHKVGTYTATVTNAGPAPAVGVTLDDQLDGQIVALEPGRASATCDGETEGCELGTIAPGESVTVTVRGRAGEEEPLGETDENTDQTDDGDLGATTRSLAGAAKAGKAAKVVHRVKVAAKNKDPNYQNNSKENAQFIPGCTSQLPVGAVIIKAGCLKKEKKTGDYVVKGLVEVNGLNMAGAEFRIKPKEPRLIVTGNVKIQAGSIVLYRGPLTLQLKGKHSLPTLPGGNFKQFPWSGKAKFDFTFDPAQKRVEVSATVQLPEKFGNALATLQFAVKHNQGLRLDSIDLKVSHLKLLKKIELNNLELGYRETNTEWHGKVDVELPGSSQLKVRAQLSFYGRSFHSLSADIDPLNRHIAYGVFLQSLGLSIALSPLKGEGRSRVSAGPNVLGKELASLKGAVSVLFKDKGTYEFTGALELVGVKLANGYLKYHPPADIDIGGGLDFLKHGYGWSAQVKGSIEGKKYGVVKGSGKISVPGPDTNGKGILSNKGVGACGKIDIPFTKKDIKVGFKYKWGDNLPHPGCDLDKLDPSRRRRAAGPQSVRLPSGLNQAEFAIRGSGGAPQVHIEGPGDAAVDVNTPDTGDEAVLAYPFYAYRVADEATTYVFIDEPAGGEWAISTLPGSVDIAEVLVARGLPDPKVTARVTRRKQAYTLRWKLRAIGGQVVRLVDVSSAGRREIIATAKGSGRKRFKPLGNAKAHRIVAEVEQDGLPRASLTAGSFKLGRTGKRRP